MTFLRLGRKPKRRTSAPDEFPQASKQAQQSIFEHCKRRLDSLPAYLNSSAGVGAPQSPVLKQQNSIPRPPNPYPIHSHTYPSPYTHLRPQPGNPSLSPPVASTTLKFASQGHLAAPQQERFEQWEWPAQTPPVPPIPQIPYQAPHYIGASTSQPYLPITSNVSPRLPRHEQRYPQVGQQHDCRNIPKWKSTANLLQLAPPKIAGAEVAASAAQLQQKTSACLNQGAALCDLIASKLDAIVTLIDGDLFSGEEKDMVIHVSNSLSTPAQQTNELQKAATRRMGHPNGKTSTNYFSKVWLYSNSRLPPHLPPFKVYMPTYPLLCLAARYSERVYSRPTGPEKEAHIEANWRSGAKAMVLKSVPVDDMNTIVLAIRGSQTFMDWTVNFRPAPSSPAGFLEDPGNHCHSGFLNVARAMITPVAARLRALLDENPARANRSCSLVITGHSAGGAVAALLYAHMMTSFSHVTDAPDRSPSQIHSSLTALTPLFKRIHCITFGAPPISLLPLQISEAARKKKSMFFAFINEGDPVPRADKAVVTSLLKLYAAPPPAPALSSTATKATELATQMGLPSLRKYGGNVVNSNSRRRGHRERSIKKQRQRLPEWHVPASTLSNAGRLVLLRDHPVEDAHGNERQYYSKDHERKYDNDSRRKAPPAGSGDGTRKRRVKRDNGKIEACIVTDEQLRSVVFGEPVYHMMSVYARRIETLATRAVTVRDYG